LLIRSPALRVALSIAFIEALPRVARDPSNVDARADLMYGAMLGGAALTGGFAFQHGLAHTLGGSFGGRASALVAAAGGSAPALVGRVLEHLPAFRDEAAHGAGRVCFYKRAQICAADVWAAHGAHWRGCISHRPPTRSPSSTIMC
jgi:hypothetical protein